MRTLTLGVLIVSGGTLAALPFRRTSPIPDASASPTEVTGPTHTALDPPARLASRTAAADQVANTAARWESDWISPPRGWSNSPAAPPAPGLEMPLTYDDLAPPIDRPAAIDANFDALTENQPVDQPVDQLVDQPVQPQANDWQETPMPSNVFAMPQPESSTGGSFASSRLEQLPKPQEQVAEATAPRTRHWIRQPD